MDETIEVSGAIAIIVLLIGLHLGTWRFIMGYSVGWCRRKLRPHAFTFCFADSSNCQVLTVSEIEHNDNDEILPLYFRSLSFMRLFLILLPAVSAINIVVCGIMFTLYTDGKNIAKIPYLTIMLIAFTFITIQGLMMVYVHKINIYVQDTQ